MPPTRITALGKTSRQTAMTSRVLSHQYVIIDEIQISSGSGKALVSNKTPVRPGSDLDSLEPFSQFVRRQPETVFDSLVFPRAGTLQDKPMSLGSYSKVEHSLRTFRIFFATVRFGLSAPRQSINLRM